MTTDDAHDTLLTPERDLSLERLSVVEIVDLLLLALARYKATGVFIEPASDSSNALRIELGSGVRTIATLAPALADALVARFAILGRLRLGDKAEQIGRLRVRAAQGVADLELLIAVRSTSGGLLGELRRILGPDDLPSSDAGADDEEEVGGVPLMVGPYRIIDELGRGGMGVVYRAQHTVLEKVVAIKLLKKGLASVPEFAGRFILEAKAASRARHPGIVDVIDFGWLKNRRAYLVMELVEGETLQSLLRRGPMETSRVLNICAQIAAALQAAAQRGVVHRDLKPANVFVDRNGVAKLGDFGVAAIVEADGTRAGDSGIVGTARYMAPEQAAGHAADTRSDLYALGCVMFEMLTGRPPFDGGAVTEIVSKQADAAIPAVNGPGGPVPQSIGMIVQRAMARRPEERYQTPLEMLADLERAARNGGWRQWLPS